MFFFSESRIFFWHIALNVCHLNRHLNRRIDVLAQCRLCYPIATIEIISFMCDEIVIALFTPHRSQWNGGKISVTSVRALQQCHQLQEMNGVCLQKIGYGIECIVCFHNAWQRIETARWEKSRLQIELHSFCAECLLPVSSTVHPFHLFYSVANFQIFILGRIVSVAVFIPMDSCVRAIKLNAIEIASTCQARQRRWRQTSGKTENHEALFRTMFTFNKYLDAFEAY